MKKIILSTLLSLVALAVNAQDSLYIYKDGTQTHKIAVSEIDSMTFSSSVDTSKMEVTDIDGNVYKTVKIGNQVWMAENLRVSHYNNGNELLNIEDDYTWGNLNSGAYCWFDNDSATYNQSFGKLYNSFVVTGDRNICPIGWHIPTDNDMDTLVTFLGGEDKAGRKLKESGNTNWVSPNIDATNETGFSAIGSGHRDGEYRNNSTIFWHKGYTFTFYGAESAGRIYSITNDSGKLNGTTAVWGINDKLKRAGRSLRCLKD